MTRVQRIVGMLTGVAMIVGGIVLFGTSIGWILQATSSENSGEIAVGASPTAEVATPAPTETAPNTATSLPIATATFTDLTLNPTVTAIPPSATSLPPSPTTAPSATLVPPTQTILPTFTATTQALTATSTPLLPTTVPTVTRTATIAPPPQITLITTPIPTPADALAVSACASLDGQTQAGLYQVESPAQIGVEQRLCLGGYPMTESVTVYLTGRSALAVTLKDEDGNGFGYAEVRYVPARNDRNRPLNMTAAAQSVSASGQITIEPTIPGIALSPQVGNPFTTFYAVLTFPDNAQRDLYLYRRTEGDTFTYVRQILLLPQPDDCVPFNPCFASDFSLSRESAGEYRFVEYSPTAGFRLFPSELAPLGFLIANPTATATPTSTPEVTSTATIPPVELTPTPEITATESPPAATETATPIPTATVEPTLTVENSPTALPTNTSVVTLQE